MAAHEGLFRVRDGTNAPVAPIELFFDLVYVLAVTQLTHQPLTNLARRPRGRSTWNVPRASEG